MRGGRACRLRRRRRRGRGSLRGGRRRAGQVLLRCSSARGPCSARSSSSAQGVRALCAVGAAAGRRRPGAQEIASVDKRHNTHEARSARGRDVRLSFARHSRLREGCDFASRRGASVCALLILSALRQGGFDRPAFRGDAFESVRVTGSPPSAAQRTIFACLEKRTSILLMETSASNKSKKVRSSRRAPSVAPATCAECIVRRRRRAPLPWQRRLCKKHEKYQFWLHDDMRESHRPHFASSSVLRRTVVAHGGQVFQNRRRAPRPRSGVRSNGSMSSASPLPRWRRGASASASMPTSCRRQR